MKKEKGWFQKLLSNKVKGWFVGFLALIFYSLTPQLLKAAPPPPRKPENFLPPVGVVKAGFYDLGPVEGERTKPVSVRASLNLKFPVSRNRLVAARAKRIFPASEKWFNGAVFVSETDVLNIRKISQQNSDFQFINSEGWSPSKTFELHRSGLLPRIKKLWEKALKDFENLNAVDIAQETLQTESQIFHEFVRNYPNLGKLSKSFSSKEIDEKITLINRAFDSTAMQLQATRQVPNTDIPFFIPQDKESIISPYLQKASLITDVNLRFTEPRLNRIQTEFSSFLNRNIDPSSLPNAREAFQFLYGTEEGFEKLGRSTFSKQRLCSNLAIHHSALIRFQSELRSVRRDLQTRRQFSKRLNRIAQSQLNLVQGPKYDAGALQAIAYTYNLFYPVTTQGNPMPSLITPYFDEEIPAQPYRRPGFFPALLDQETKFVLEQTKIAELYKEKESLFLPDPDAG